MKYPLFFRFIQEVRADNVAALVIVQGSCLMKFEDEQWWAEGVQPGGVVGMGSFPLSAAKDFETTWTIALKDTAGEAGSQGAFEAAIREIFEQISLPAAQEWQAARRAIHAGKLIPSDPYLKTLPRAHEGFEPLISVLNIAEAVSLPVEEADVLQLAA